MNHSPIASDFRKTVGSLSVKAHKLYKLNKVFEGLSQQDKELALKSAKVLLKLLEQT